MNTSRVTRPLKSQSHNSLIPPIKDLPKHPKSLVTSSSQNEIQKGTDLSLDKLQLSSVDEDVHLIVQRSGISPRTDQQHSSTCIPQQQPTFAINVIRPPNPNIGSASIANCVILSQPVVQKELGLQVEINQQRPGVKSSNY